MHPPACVSAKRTRCRTTIPILLSYRLRVLASPETSNSAQADGRNTLSVTTAARRRSPRGGGLEGGLLDPGFNDPKPKNCKRPPFMLTGNLTASETNLDRTASFDRFAARRAAAYSRQPSSSKGCRSKGCRSRRAHLQRGEICLVDPPRSSMNRLQQVRLNEQKLLGGI